MYNYQCPSSMEVILLATSWKDPMTTFLSVFSLGSLGVDRFYLCATGLDFLKLITCKSTDLWALINLFTAHSCAHKVNLMVLNTF